MGVQNFAGLLAATFFSASLVQATSYGIVDTFVGPSFLSGFTAQAIGDPTSGRVK